MRDREEELIRDRELLISVCFRLMERLKWYAGGGEAPAVEADRLIKSIAERERGAMTSYTINEDDAKAHAKALRILADDILHEEVETRFECSDRLNVLADAFERALKPGDEELRPAETHQAQIVKLTKEE